MYKSANTEMRKGGVFKASFLFGVSVFRLGLFISVHFCLFHQFIDELIRMKQLDNSQNQGELHPYIS